MHKRLLVLSLLLAAVAFPASAHAIIGATTIDRQVVGYGSVKAGTSSTCTSPQSTPGATSANVNGGTAYDCDPTPLAAGTYDHCTTVDPSGSYSCSITISATVAGTGGGWSFDHWSGDCTGTSATCTLETQDTECDPLAKPPCHTIQFGDYVAVAHFVDTRAPTTTFASGPAQNSVVYSDAQSQSFTWSTNEDTENPSAGCKRDAGPFVGCSSGNTWSSIADGIHDFCVHSTDASGLQGADTCRHWEQETNPTASILTHPASTTGTPDASFTWTSNKAGHPADGSTLSYQCSLDGAPFAACPAAGKSYDHLANGSHNFQVEAVFTAALGGGAHTSTAASFTWTQADTTGPSITLASSPDGTVNVTDSRQATISWTGTEPNESQTFLCKLDTDPAGYQPCTSAHTLSNLSDGIHDFYIQGRDFLGNLGPVKDVHWDQETPAVASLTGGPAEGADVNSSHASFTFTTTKAGAAFECSVDGSAFAACTSPDGIDVSSDGSHTFSVRATFTAPLGGSYPGAAVTRTWSVDTVPPDTTITGGPSNGLATSDTGATFAFSATEAGSFQCSLDGAPAAPCTSPQALSGLAVGQHTFTVAAVDAADNVDPSAATRSWQVIAGGAAVIDADHDGYPASIDCNDGSAAIHPGAVDVPGNKVDENCDGHDAAVPPAPSIGATVSGSWRFFKKYTKLSSLSALSVPAGAKVTVSCKGKKRSCKFKSKTVSVTKAGKVSLTKYFKRAKLAKGTKITITVTKAGTVGIRVIYKTRNGKLPAKTQSNVT